MLENPFKPIRPESETDPAANAHLVGKFLGPEAQAAYEKLDQEREGKKVDTQADLTLTDAEKAVVKEAREKEVWDRAHYIRWAESLGKDEDWVDETFTFHDDGTVECWNLDLSSITELHGFPSELTINGGLFLENVTTADGVTLPKSIGGSLTLRNLTSAAGLIIPKDFHVSERVYTNSTLRPFFEKLKNDGKIGGRVVVV